MNVLAAGSSSNGGSGAIGLVLIVALIALYWVPSIVAGTRHVRNFGSIVVVNLLAGWTLVGWVIALAMACRSVDGQVAAAPVVQGSVGRHGR
jgi:hypothetical protein